MEDFNEVLLLCGNGYGIGAEKLIRGMYERAVTLVYLHQHPEYADDFLDYHKVAVATHLPVAKKSMQGGSYAITSAAIRSVTKASITSLTFTSL